MTIIIACVILDQLSKYISIVVLSGVTTLPIIPNVFHLTYVQNTGAAFSLFSDMRLFLIIITIVFTAILGYLFYVIPKTKKYHTVNLALSLMIGGALGNLIDRIRLGYVVDFFDFKLIGFAIFNLADCFVVIGGLMLIAALLRNRTLLETPKKGRRRSRRSAPETKTAVKDPPREQARTLKRDPEKESSKKITPEVHSTLRRLKNTRPVSFSPSPRISAEREEPTKEIEIEPKPTRKRARIMEYEEIVEIDREEKRPANRYRLNSQHYEDLVRAQRNNEYRESVEEEQDTKEEPESRETTRTDRYTNILDSYEASVRRQRSKEEPPEEPVEVEKPKRKPQGVKRYTDETDSYIQSIKEASKKHYTED